MPEALERARPPAPQADAGGIARPLLLLIDDEPFVGRFLAHAAEECRYQALATATAESFRREYRLLRPDVIAVDLAMPGGDGIELLRFLAEEKCRAPVLIVSGFDQRVLESAMRLGEALGLHMAGTLTKPVRLHEMESVLAALGREAAP
jgi:two-component system, OmpR family, response regulator